MITLVLLALLICTAHSGPNKCPKYKKQKKKGSKDKGNNKISEWDLTIFGHRGGIAGFVPQHSLLSFTIGAQNGADYLEPDVTFTSDAVQIIRHHPDLAEATNVEEIYDTNSDKYTPADTIEYYWRTVEEGGPSTHPYLETSAGFYSWDFTFAEIEELSVISNDLQPSPLDGLELAVLRLEDLLILINDTLIPTLERPIGLIPELKYSHEYTQRLGTNVERLHLELLAQYGYLSYDSGSDYYSVRTLCEVAIDSGLSECDETVYGNKPSVIIQSFNAPSLKIFRNYTDAPLLYLGWYDYDLMNTEFVEWVMSFADGLGLNTAGMSGLNETLIEMCGMGTDCFEDFAIYEYTLDSEVSAYFETINTGFVDGVFTDNVDTARVVQETLDFMQENNVKIKTDKNNGYSALANEEMSALSEMDSNGNIECKSVFGGNMTVMVIFCVLFGGSVLANVVFCTYLYYSNKDLYHRTADEETEMGTASFSETK